MSISRLVAANALSLSAARIINPVASLFLLAAIARSLGAEGVGHYSLVLALFYMASNLGALGLRTPITRAVSTDRSLAPEYLGVTLALGTVSGVLAIGSIVVLVRLLEYSAEIQSATYILCIAIIPSIWMLHIDAIFISFHKARHIAAIAVLENSIKVLAGLVLLYAGFGVATLFWLILILRIASLFVYAALYSRAIDSSGPRLSWNVGKELARVAPVFSTNLLLSAPFARLDLILLSKFATMSEVGLYSAALRLVTVASYVPRSLKASVLPAFSESISISTKQFAALFDRSLSYLAHFGVAASLGFLVLSPTVIHVIFGADFSRAIPIMQLLGFTLLLGSSTSVFTAALFAGHKEKLDLLSNILRMIIMVILLVILIPRFGLSGAGYGQVAASVSHFAMTLIFVSLTIIRPNVFRSFGIPMFAAVIAYMVTVVLGDFPNIISGAAAMITYVVIGLILDSTIRNDILSIAGSIVSSVKKFLPNETK